MEIRNLGNRVVSNWLIPGNDGYILIDTGYENGFRRFQRKLKKTGIQPEEIKILFLTHAHDDHAGFLNDVFAATPAKVILHPETAERLKTGQNSFEGGCSSRMALFFCRILALLGKGEHKYPPIREEYLARLVPLGSETCQAMRLPFQVMETPGHTADHISLLKDDILFCGDAAMNGFPSRKRVTIWIENLLQFRQSWEKILKTGPKKIFPAHGKPFPVADLEKYLPDLDRIRLYPLKKLTSERNGDKE